MQKQPSMTNENEICGRTKRDGSGDACALPAGWGTDHQGEGACKLHGGCGGDVGDPGGASEGNQNAQRHGLHATPEYLLEDLDEHHLDTYHALHESLCSRYERIHEREPDYAARKRLSRTAVEIVKEDLADEYLREQAHTDNPLVEEQEQMTESGPWVSEETNKVLPVLAQLKRETRLTLKAMGLLQDPQSETADAIRDLANDDYEIIIDDE